MVKAKLRKAVFPVGGRGLRMRPISRVVQKELLPVGTKALIHFAIQEVADSGIEEIHIVARHKQQLDYFTPRTNNQAESLDLHDKAGLQPIEELAERVKFFFHRTTGGIGGFGGSVLAAERFVGDEPFALVLFDDFIDAEKPVLRQIIETYESSESAVFALTHISKKEIPEFGVVRYKRVARGLYRILEAIEKPSPETVSWSPLGIVGRYVLTPSIFGMLRECLKQQKANSIELTPALDMLAKTKAVYGLRFKGEYIHAGTEAGYLKTVMYYGLRRSTYGPVLCRYARKLL